MAKYEGVASRSGKEKGKGKRGRGGRIEEERRGKERREDEQLGEIARTAVLPT